jgi:hypothetical protein
MTHIFQFQTRKRRTILRQRAVAGAVDPKGDVFVLNSDLFTPLSKCIQYIHEEMQELLVKSPNYDGELHV